MPLPGVLPFLHIGQGFFDVPAFLHEMFDPPSVPFGQSTPDPKPFVVGDRIFEAVETNQTVMAEGFGNSSGVPPVGEEQFHV